MIRGARVDYSGQSLGALGYAIKTADGWQDFVSLALESTLGTKAVHRGRQYRLGTRLTGEVRTTPDLSVDFPGNTLLVDAKYKGRSPKPMATISAADLYEAFAFSRSAGIKRIALVYPRSAALPRVKVGSMGVFDEVRVEDAIITGVHVECRGLAELGGFGEFGRGLAKGLEAVA